MSQNRSVDVPSVLPANWADHCQGNGYNDYGQECPGYGDARWPCRTCAAYQERDVQNSAGFVETDSEDIFPITVIAYLGTHGTKEGGEYVKIANVRESSITIEERKGVRTLVCESFVTERIAYIPFVTWYMTEVQRGVQE